MKTMPQRERRAAEEKSKAARTKVALAASLAEAAGQQLQHQQWQLELKAQVLGQASVLWSFEGLRCLSFG